MSGHSSFLDVALDRAPADRLALVELARDGSRREWRFGEVAEASRRAAGTLRERGVARGDVVMTLVGNRPEWVIAMVACFRLGASRCRAPSSCGRRTCGCGSRRRAGLIVCDERNADTLAAAGRRRRRCWCRGAELTAGEPVRRRAARAARRRA